MSLFQTTAWQRSWWETWGKTPGFHLLTEGGSGRCGLYLDHYRLRKVLPIRCLQYTGTNYRRLKTPRAEYNAGIESLEALIDEKWHEAVFRDVLKNSDEYTAILELAQRSKCMMRVLASDTAYQIDSSGDWSEYLSSLGSGTRARVYNRRSLFEASKPEWFNFFPNKMPEFFNLLNEFHVKRWGKPCFIGPSLEFHLRFLNEWAKKGRSAVLEVISVDGVPVSVIYDVVYSGVVYNIQAGFDTQFNKKLSLGKLHLGYRLEETFQDSQTQTYDLLAGHGKSENYKASMANKKVHLSSVMLVRSPAMKLLYKLHSGLSAAE